MDITIQRQRMYLLVLPMANLEIIGFTIHMAAQNIFMIINAYNCV